jgi:putative ABC transport system permease protein
MFAKKPLLAVVAIATLAIGIGASTAIFSVLYVVLLRPLPYPNASRLCVVWTVLGKEERAPASGPELLSLGERNSLFEQVAGIWVQTGALTGRNEPVQVKLGWVTSNFLSLLAPKLQLGRFFLPEEQGKGRAPVVILSYELWKTRYGSDPAIVGHAILLNGQPYTVVGILPGGFKLFFPDGAAVPPHVDVYSPFPEELAGQPRDQEYIRVIATLHPGMNVRKAQSELSGVAAQLRSQFQEYSQQDLHLQIVALQQDATDNSRIPLLVLFAGSGLLLSIVCANLAMLLLAQASGRLGEVSLRAALGAEPRRIVRQLLTESVLLSSIGGIAGILLSFGLLRVLSFLEPAGIARNTSIALSLPALCFALLSSVLCGMLFGLSPALIAREANLASLLRQNSRSTTDNKQNLRQILIGGEVALTFIILTSSILLLTTLIHIRRVNPGFDAENALTFRISLLGKHYSSDEIDREFLVELERRLSALPNVVDAGFVSHLPFDDSLPNWYDYVWRDGAPKDEQNTLMADHRAASRGFFGSLRARFISGRNFDTSDEVSRRKVAIIDEALAKQLWPGQDAVGKLINVESQHDGDSSRDLAAVIGVIRHIDFHSLTLPERGQVYLPYRMAARHNVYFVVHTKSSPASLIAAVRREVADLDRELPVAALRPMSDYVLEARTQSRFVAILFASLAGIALLLSSIGIYAVTANSVVRRRREIGIRMAFGAKPRDIVKLASTTGFRPALVGAILGLCLSFLVTPLLSNLLFGIRPTSVLTLGSVFVFVSSLSLFAVLIPTASVLCGNPMSVLRDE